MPTICIKNGNYNKLTKFEDIFCRKKACQSIIKNFGELVHIHNVAVGWNHLSLHKPSLMLTKNLHKSNDNDLHVN